MHADRQPQHRHGDLSGMWMPLSKHRKHRFWIVPTHANDMENRLERERERKKKKEKRHSMKPGSIMLSRRKQICPQLSSLLMLYFKIPCLGWCPPATFFKDWEKHCTTHSCLQLHAGRLQKDMHGAQCTSAELDSSVCYKVIMLCGLAVFQGFLWI